MLTSPSVFKVGNIEATSILLGIVKRLGLGLGMGMGNGDGKWEWDDTTVSAKINQTFVQESSEYSSYRLGMGVNRKIMN